MTYTPPSLIIPSKEGLLRCKWEKYECHDPEYLEGYCQVHHREWKVEQHRNRVAATLAQEPKPIKKERVRKRDLPQPEPAKRLEETKSQPPPVQPAPSKPSAAKPPLPLVIRQERPPPAAVNASVKRCCIPGCHCEAGELELCNACRSIFVCWRRYMMAGQQPPIIPTKEQDVVFRKMHAQLQGKTGS